MIKTKQSGHAYDIRTLKAKRSGVYVNLVGAFAKRAGHYQIVGGSAPPGSYFASKREAAQAIEMLSAVVYAPNKFEMAYEDAFASDLIALAFNNISTLAEYAGAFDIMSALVGNPEGTADRMEMAALVDEEVALFNSITSTTDTASAIDALIGIYNVVSAAAEAAYAIDDASAMLGIPARFAMRYEAVSPTTVQQALTSAIAAIAEAAIAIETVGGVLYQSGQGSQADNGVAVDTVAQFLTAVATAADVLLASETVTGTTASIGAAFEVIDALEDMAARLESVRMTEETVQAIDAMMVVIAGAVMVTDSNMLTDSLNGLLAAMQSQIETALIMEQSDAVFATPAYTSIDNETAAAIDQLVAVAASFAVVTDTYSASETMQLFMGASQTVSESGAASEMANFWKEGIGEQWEMTTGVDSGAATGGSMGARNEPGMGVDSSVTVAGLPADRSEPQTPSNDQAANTSSMVYTGEMSVLDEFESVYAGNPADQSDSVTAIDAIDQYSGGTRSELAQAMALEIINTLYQGYATVAEAALAAELSNAILMLMAAQTETGTAIDARSALADYPVTRAEAAAAIDAANRVLATNDPSYNQVITLINGNNEIVDRSRYNRVVSNYPLADPNSAVIPRAGGIDADFPNGFMRFPGNASAYLALDSRGYPSNNTNLHTVGEDFDISQDDWTIEIDVKMQAITGSPQCIVSGYDKFGAYGGFGLYGPTTNNLYFYLVVNGQSPFVKSSTVTVAVGNKYTITVQRLGQAYTMWINGLYQGQELASTGATPVVGGRIYLGINGDGLQYFLQADLARFRLSRVARYTPLQVINGYAVTATSWPIQRLPEPSLPLDNLVAGLWQACGLQRLLSSYNGPCVRVSRGDGAQMDIGFVGNSIDVQTMLNFANAYPQNTSLGCVTFYDQSGLGNHWTCVPANAPTIVSAGSYVHSLTFNGSNQGMASVNPAPAVSVYSLFAQYSYVSFNSNGGQTLFGSTNVGIAAHNALAIQYQTSDARTSIYMFKGAGADGNYSQNLTATTTGVDYSDLWVCDWNKLTLTGSRYSFNARWSLISTSRAYDGRGVSFTPETLYLANVGLVSGSGGQWSNMQVRQTAVWTINQAERAGLITQALRSYPFDKLTAGMIALYGLTRLLTSYTGPLVRVYRPQNGKSLDIGYVAGGGIDLAAMVAFAQGQLLTVSILYDQLGQSARHLVQPITASQPTIYDSTGYYGCLYFDGVNDWLYSAGPLGFTPVNLTFASNYLWRGTASSNPGNGADCLWSLTNIFQAGHNSFQIQWTPNANVIACYVGTGGSGAGYSQSNGYYDTNQMIDMWTIDRALGPNAGQVLRWVNAIRTDPGWTGNVPPTVPSSFTSTEQIVFGCSAVNASPYTTATVSVPASPQNPAINLFSSAVYATRQDANAAAIMKALGEGGNADPFYDSVVLCLHFDVDARDSSKFARAMTLNGNAAIGTTSPVPKYGRGYLKLDGAAASTVTMTRTTNDDFGTDDFTLESWVYLLGGASGQQIISEHGSGSISWGFSQTNQLQLNRSNVAIIATGTAQLNTGVWMHVAVVRRMGVLYGWADGVKQFEQPDTNNYTGDGNSGAVSTTIFIGASNGGLPLKGHMDDFRITKGAARYIAAFPNNAARQGFPVFPQYNGVSVP